LLIALVLTILLPAAALAETHSGDLNLPTAASLNGKQIQPGTYKVRWEGEGSSAQVSILKGKATVATANASVVNRDRAERSNAVVFGSASDVQKTISEIRFEGKKTVLTFENASGGGATAQ
jgi:hypothetical protein